MAYHKMLQHLSRINGDAEKIKQSTLNVDTQIYSFATSECEQKQNDIISYLKQERKPLTSIGELKNSRNQHPHHHHSNLTPQRSQRKSRIRPHYSSTKKPRPQIRKTTLRPKINNNIKTNILSTNINSTNRINIHQSANRKVPQKKLTFITKEKEKDNKMDVDTDCDVDSENNEDENENIAPTNLMNANSMGMIDEKLKEHRRLRQFVNKPAPVRALQNA
eukprot:1666_1